MSGEAIRFDVPSARTLNAVGVERAGMFLLRLGAQISSAWDFIGYSIGARAVRKLLPSGRNIAMNLAPDTQFEYPYGDGYWSILLDTRKTYSPEMEAFLKSCRDIDYVFLDCGANVGYMSALVTSEAYGAKQAVAIEADADNFRHLKRNAEINANRFECRHNAIHTKSGEIVNLYGAKHEAISAVGDGGEARGTVETLAIDDLLGWAEANGAVPVILKLDIEGVEIPALEGARKLLQRDCLIIYEEHGNDPDHAISRHLHDTLGMELFHDAGGRAQLVPFASMDEIGRFKPNKRVGYDFFATRSPFWLERIKGGMKAAPAH